MLIINDENALRVKCLDVLSEEVGSLIELLESELARCERLGRPGVGLAAPQIGIAKNIAIVRTDKININLVNARIDHSYDQKMFRDEGCLSFPGRVENTMRYQEIHVTNNLVYPNKFIATEFVAVVCQHELDHLNSTLFFDKMIPKQLTIVNTNKVGPNDPCVCGSNKKFKKCCR